MRFTNKNRIFSRMGARSSRSRHLEAFEIPVIRPKTREGLLAAIND